MSKVALPSSISNADGSVTVKLKYPITFGEETIEELKFPRPKARHMKGIKVGEKMGADEMLTLMSKMTGQFPQALEELDLVDFQYCGGVLDGFLDNSAKGGKMA